MCLCRTDPAERPESHDRRNPEAPEPHPAAGVQRESDGHGEPGRAPTLLPGNALCRLAAH